MGTWDVIVASYDAPYKITFETGEVNRLRSDSSPFQNDSKRHKEHG